MQQEDRSTRTAMTHENSGVGRLNPDAGELLHRVVLLRRNAAMAAFD